jgi:sugar phosphate permease
MVALSLSFARSDAYLAATVVGLSAFAFSSVHGILTSTCAMDFAGSGATGTAVGLLDGTQKFGSGFQGVLLGWVINKYGYTTYLQCLYPACFVAICLVGSVLMKRPPTQEKEPLLKDGADDDKDLVFAVDVERAATLGDDIEEL